MGQTQSYQTGQFAHSAEEWIALLEAGDYEEFAAGIEQHAKLMKKVLHSRNGDTGLHILAQKGNTEGIVRSVEAYVKRQQSKRGSPFSATDLCKLKAKVLNMANFKGRTPLMSAAKSGHADSILWLLENGADPAARDRTGGSTAAHYAAAAGHEAVLRALHAHVPPFSQQHRHPVNYVDLLNANGFTPLHMAAWHKRYKVVKVLCEMGASLYSVSNWPATCDSVQCPAGSTPLHVAAMSGSSRTVRALIAGYVILMTNPPPTSTRPPVDPRLVQDLHGNLPFAIALQRNNTRLLALLHPLTPLDEVFDTDNPDDRLIGVPKLEEIAAKVVQQRLLGQLEEAETVLTGLPSVHQLARPILDGGVTSAVSHVGSDDDDDALHRSSAGSLHDDTAQSLRGISSGFSSDNLPEAERSRVGGDEGGSTRATPVAGPLPPLLVHTTLGLPGARHVAAPEAAAPTLPAAEGAPEPSPPPTEPVLGPTRSAGAPMAQPTPTVATNDAHPPPEPLCATRTAAQHVTVASTVVDVGEAPGSCSTPAHVAVGQDVPATAPNTSGHPKPSPFAQASTLECMDTVPGNLATAVGTGSLGKPPKSGAGSTSNLRRNLSGSVRARRASSSQGDPLSAAAPGGVGRGSSWLAAGGGAGGREGDAMSWMERRGAWRKRLGALPRPASHGRRLNSGLADTPETEGGAAALGNGGDTTTGWMARRSAWREGLVRHQRQLLNNAPAPNFQRSSTAQPLASPSMGHGFQSSPALMPPEHQQQAVYTLRLLGLGNLIGGGASSSMSLHHGGAAPAPGGQVESSVEHQINTAIHMLRIHRLTRGVSREDMGLSSEANASGPSRVCTIPFASTQALVSNTCPTLDPSVHTLPELSLHSATAGVGAQKMLLLQQLKTSHSVSAATVMAPSPSCGGGLASMGGAVEEGVEAGGHHPAPAPSHLAPPLGPEASHSHSQVTLHAPGLPGHQNNGTGAAVSAFAAPYAPSGSSSAAVSMAGAADPGCVGSGMDAHTGPVSSAQLTRVLSTVLRGDRQASLSLRNPSIAACIEHLAVGAREEVPPAKQEPALSSLRPQQVDTSELWDDMCGVCMDNGKFVEFSCHHKLCVTCCRELIKINPNKASLCPFCRSYISTITPWVPNNSK